MGLGAEWNLEITGFDEGSEEACLQEVWLRQVEKGPRVLPWGLGSRYLSLLIIKP